MRIHVSKDGQRFGPYTIDEIKAHLVAGHFSETDHGMSEDTDEWLHISDLLAASDVSPAAVPISKDSSEDDIDYEKLKQWEEQFEDFEDEEQDMSDEPSVQPSTVSTPPPAPTAPVGPSPTQPTNVESVPQQTVPEPSAVETQPSKTSSATSESSPPQPASEEDDTDKEPPPTRRRRVEPEDEDYEDDPRPRKRRGSRRSSAKKISGMNQGQTVIVVKGGGIGSKIFTTLIVLLVVSLIIGVIGFGAFFVAPQAVGPLLQKIGIPVEIPAAGKEEPSSEAPAIEGTETVNFAGLTLTDDQIQQLRSIAVEFFKTADGEGLRGVASVEPDLGVNDEDLLALEVMAPKLVWLDLSKGNLTDVALPRLSTLSNLRRLYLEDNQGVTSRGVSNLSALGKLQCLNLVGTSLDDSVVDTLSGMSSLREVYLWRSGVSPDAVQRLRAARPDMLVQAG